MIQRFYRLSTLVFLLLALGGSVRASEPLPGEFLVTLNEGSVPAQVASRVERLGGRMTRIRGSARLWEISGLRGYGAQDLERMGGFGMVEQNAWLPDQTSPAVTPVKPLDLLEHPTDISWLAGSLSRSASSLVYPDDLQKGANWALERIHAPEAWSRRTSTDEVVVAVLDSGVDITHPDLRDNLWVNPGEIPSNGIDDDRNGWVDDIHGYDSHYEKVEVQDQVGHGTYLAGIIGAVGNNGIGMTGVAWKTRLMVIRGDDHRRMSWTGAVKGGYYARDNGARVVNASWGTYTATGGIREMLRDLEDSGVMVVNAVGNNGNDIDTGHRAYPAGFATSNLIVVSAFHPSEKLVHFADYGPKYVHLAAPGWANPTTFLGGKYGTQAGCSVAAPYVTAAVAMVWAEHPEWTHHQVREQILSTVDRVPALSDKVATGGVLNLARALGVSER
jgi:subtilisin family serine protease